jgi:predicted lipoprotein with Yx(FWY)xxD motif
MSPERLPGPRRWLVTAGVLGTLAAVVLPAGAALGVSTLTVRSSANSTLGETVVVNAAGRTLYSLGGESAHHLLCKSSECARLWPPLSVPSRTTRLKAAAGVHGALGMIKRPNGSMQVTLRGKPLYRYSGDRLSGQAAGEGIRSFGGTWHAVTASSAAQTPSPAPMTPEGTPQYGY